MFTNIYLNKFQENANQRDPIQLLQCRQNKLGIYNGLRIDYAFQRYGRLDAIWMLLHSTAQSHNTQTEFSKTGIDGGAITTEEHCSSYVRGMRIVLLF
jgi:hypothetical protein